jgi:hypothetical protein
VDTLETAERQLTSRPDRPTIEGRTGYAEALAALDSTDVTATWILERAAVTRDHGPFARAYVRRLALAAVNVYQGARHSAANLLNQWDLHCEPSWPGEELSALIDEADAERTRELSRRVEPWQQRARERMRERRKVEEERKAKADLNRRLTEALGTSARYVRMLRSEGTTVRATAETMAKILGGKPETYLRPPRRRGRRADLVALLMKAPADGCDFPHFVAEPPEDLDEQSSEMIGVLRARGAADFKSLEALVAFVGALEFESVDMGCAADVWRAFKRWRVMRIATLACFAVDEGQDLI